METGGQFLSSVIGLFYEPEYETAPYTVLSQERENVSFFFSILFLLETIAENRTAQIKKLNSTEFTLHFLHYARQTLIYFLSILYIHCSFVSICIFCNIIIK
jgi:hypothetical protein